MNNNWKSIWDEKGSSVLHGGRAGLADLIREDGFDSGAGDHSLESWQAFTHAVYRKLAIEAGARVLEVGCGCGAFLYDACQLGAAVSGVDYSYRLIAAARRALPMAEFLQAEACALPFADDSFDVVICHSVFQYFASQSYAETVVQEMLRVSDKRSGRIAILDVNDVEREEDFYRIRGASIGPTAYREKYADYPHRFYSKQWFENLLGTSVDALDIVDQAIEEYQNSAFRFNVYARRSPGAGMKSHA